MIIYKRLRLDGQEGSKKVARSFFFMKKSVWNSLAALTLNWTPSTVGTHVYAASTEYSNYSFLIWQCFPTALQPHTTAGNRLTKSRQTSVLHWDILLSHLRSLVWQAAQPLLECEKQQNLPCAFLTASPTNNLYGSIHLFIYPSISFLITYRPSETSIIVNPMGWKNPLTLTDSFSVLAENYPSPGQSLCREIVSTHSFSLS